MNFVFVSIAPCGHAQSAYADVLQSDGSRWVEEIIADLRFGLTVKRISDDEYRDAYAKQMLCGCDEYRKFLNSKTTEAVRP